MAQRDKKTLHNDEYSVLFINLFNFLFKEKCLKMTTIAEKTGIKYDRLINIKRGASKGNELLVMKLQKAFPELNKEFNLNVGNIPSKVKTPHIEEDTEELRKEVDRLKTENLAIYRKLVKCQEKLIELGDFN